MMFHPGLHNHWRDLSWRARFDVPVFFVLWADATFVVGRSDIHAHAADKTRALDIAKKKTI